MSASVLWHIDSHCTFFIAYAVFRHVHKLLWLIIGSSINLGCVNLSLLILWFSISVTLGCGNKLCSFVIQEYFSNPSSLSLASSKWHKFTSSLVVCTFPWKNLAAVSSHTHIYIYPSMLAIILLLGHCGKTHAFVKFSS